MLGIRGVCLLALMGLATAHAAVPAAWVSYDDHYFSFRYPAQWSVEKLGGASVAIRPQDWQSSALSLGIEFTTSFDGNINAFFAAEKVAIRNAVDSRFTVTFDTLQPGRRGGTELGTTISTPGVSQTLELYTNVLPVQQGLYVLRLTTRGDTSYNHIVQFGEPFTDSISFRLPSGQLAGIWSSGVRQTSVDGYIVPPRTFAVSLSLSAQGRYEYVVQQTEGIAWQLNVTGAWAIIDPPAGDASNGVWLRLSPLDVKFSPAGPQANQASEVQRLVYEGYPDTGTEELSAVFQAGGVLSLKRRFSSRGMAFRPAGTAGATTAAVRVVDAAAFTEYPVAPGSLISLIARFDTSEFVAQRLPLPASLGAISITVGGRTAPLLYVGPTQINAQVPFELPPGPAAVLVMVNATVRYLGTVSVIRASPKIFVGASNRAIATNQNYSRNAPENPAKGGEYLTAYITGQGLFKTQVANGAAAPYSPLPYTAAVTSVTIGGRTAEVLYSGGAPTLAGVGQVNLRIPAGLAAGDYPLVITIDGMPSNSALVSITR